MGKILFVADPVDRWLPEGETTFYLVAEAVRRGFQCFTTTLKGLYFDRGAFTVHARELKVEGQKDLDSPFVYDWAKEVVVSKLAAFDSIHLRKDPPVDMNFVHHLQLLAAAEEQVPMYNPPSSLLKWNEKLAILNFPEFLSPTQVGQPESLGKPIFKPLIRKSLDEAQGRGVQKFEDPGQATAPQDQLYVMDQEFNPDIVEGDTRILLFGGEVVGQFVRVPAKGNYLANLRHGATVEAKELTDQEHTLCRAIGPWAKRKKLFLVGLDVIGGKLSEVNVTSVRGIKEVLRAGGPDLSQDYWDRIH